MPYVQMWLSCEMDVTATICTVAATNASMKAASRRATRQVHMPTCATAPDAEAISGLCCIRMLQFHAGQFRTGLTVVEIKLHDHCEGDGGLCGARAPSLALAVHFVVSFYSLVRYSRARKPQKQLPLPANTKERRPFLGVHQAS